MTIEVTTIRESIDDHAIIGRNLRRVIEASGFHNTASEPGLLAGTVIFLAGLALIASLLAFY